MVDEEIVVLLYFSYKRKGNKRDKEKCQKSEIKRNKRRIFTSTIEP